LSQHSAVTCCLAPDIAIEYFEQAAVIFLGAAETFLTVNEAAADLLGSLIAAFNLREFQHQTLVDLLLQQYDLEPLAAAGAAERLVAQWLACGILVHPPQPDTHESEIAYDTDKRRPSGRHTPACQSQPGPARGGG
jgi:hypothetical protein